MGSDRSLARRFFAVLRRALLRRSPGEAMEVEALDTFDELYRDACRDGRRLSFLAGELRSLVGTAVEESRRQSAPGAPSPGATPRRLGERGGRESQLSGLLHDLMTTMGSLGRRPAFTATVVLVLALGIGANTAVFTVVHGVLLRPLPYEDAHRLALVWGRMTSTDVHKAPWSGLDLLDFRERTRSFASIGGVFVISSTLSSERQAEPIHLGFATVNLFDVLGVEAALGRTFRPEDQLFLDPASFFDPEMVPPSTAAVLSWELWQRRYGGSEEILGRSLRINGQPMHVVGIAPPELRLYLPADASMPGDVDVWVANAIDLRLGSRDQQWITVVARLADGVTVRDAQAEMNRLATQLREENQFHANVGMEVDVVPMHEDVVGHAEPVLLALLGAVGFVLLVSCANVANLLLVRNQDRRREIAIRMAIGGARLRIVRELLLESLVLALTGGVGGLLLARAFVELLLLLRPQSVPRIDDLAMSWPVILFLLGVSLLAALLFGIAPGLMASRTEPSSVLGERAATGGGRQQTLRRALIVAEVAISLVLLIGAGLLLRSFTGLLRIEPGFDHRSVITVNVALPFFKYRDPESAVRLHLDLSERLAALPGVERVGGVTPLPLAGGGQHWFGPYALDEASDEEWSRNQVDYRPALPSVFATLGTKLLAGRTFTRRDLRLDAARTVVVDESMARRAWPDGRAVGERIMVMRPDPAGSWYRYWAEVIGVVEHVRYDDLRRDGRETIYFPYSDWYGMPLDYTIRHSESAGDLGPAIARTIRELDPDIPAAPVVPLSRYVRDALAPTRFALVCLGVFAGIALVLASVGLHGVLAYTVRQRTRELAVRMAFGAGRGRLLRLVLGDALLLIGAGLATGLAGALLVTRLLAGLVFGVSTTDPVTFAGLSLLLGVVSLAACLSAALRATRLDPVVALRSE